MATNFHGIVIHINQTAAGKYTAQVTVGMEKTFSTTALATEIEAREAVAVWLKGEVDKIVWTEKT
jgi:hypothetical protein